MQTRERAHTARSVPIHKKNIYIYIAMEENRQGNLPRQSIAYEGRSVPRITGNQSDVITNAICT